MFQLELSSMIINIINDCNLNCSHCFNRKFVSKGGCLSLEQIDFIVREGLLYNVKKIYISGGEPLLHPDLYAILRHLTHTFPRIEIGIATNGTLLTDDVIDRINSCGNIVVQVSIDGGNAETYEQIRGAGIFPAFLAGFEALKKSSAKKKTARTCVSAINYKDIESIYRLCVSNKIEPSFLFVAEMGNAMDNWNKLKLSVAQKMSVINTIERLNREYGYSISVPIPAYKCSFTQLMGQYKNQYEQGDIGKWSLSISTEGNVTCCQFLENHPIGNIFTNTIKEMFTGNVFTSLCSKAAERIRLIDENKLCEKCSIKSSCGRGCIGAAIDGGDLCLLDGNCNDRVVYAVFKNCEYI